MTIEHDAICMQCVGLGKEIPHRNMLTSQSDERSQLIAFAVSPVGKQDRFLKILKSLCKKGRSIAPPLSAALALSANYQRRSHVELADSLSPEGSTPLFIFCRRHTTSLRT